MNLLAQIAPQMMGQAGITAMAITQALTARGIYRLIDRINNLRHLNSRLLTGQLITTARTAHTGDQITAPKLGKQLFKIRKRDALPLRDISQRDWPMLCMKRQVEHGGDGVTAFGSQAHGTDTTGSLVCGNYPIPEYLSQL